MDGGERRLELRIDVLDKQDQRAQPLKDLKPSDLIGAILQEFRELEYLGDCPEDYQLVKAYDKQTTLNETLTLAQQLTNGERLLLVENERPLPEDTEKPPAQIYLREQETGKLFKIRWVPAYIGRKSESQPFNEWVAVDLQSFPAGLRVSRRHILLTESRGQYLVENRSHNPVTVLKHDGDKTASIPVDRKRVPLGNEDILRLERSGIELKFIVRHPAPSPNLDDGNTAESRAA